MPLSGLTRRRPSDTRAVTIDPTTENPSNNPIASPSNTASTLNVDAVEALGRELSRLLG